MALRVIDKFMIGAAKIVLLIEEPNQCDRNLLKTVLLTIKKSLFKEASFITELKEIEIILQATNLSQIGTSHYGAFAASKLDGLKGILTYFLPDLTKYYIDNPKGFNKFLEEATFHELRHLLDFKRNEFIKLRKAAFDKATEILAETCGRMRNKTGPGLRLLWISFRSYLFRFPELLMEEGLATFCQRSYKFDKQTFKNLYQKAVFEINRAHNKFAESKFREEMRKLDAKAVMTKAEGEAKIDQTQDVATREALIKKYKQKLGEIKLAMGVLVDKAVDYWMSELTRAMYPLGLHMIHTILMFTNYDLKHFEKISPVEFVKLYERACKTAGVRPAMSYTNGSGGVFCYGDFLAEIYKFVEMPAHDLVKHLS